MRVYMVMSWNDPCVAEVTRTGDWRVIGQDDLPAGARSDYVAAGTAGARIDIPFPIRTMLTVRAK